MTSALCVGVEAGVHGPRWDGRCSLELLLDRRSVVAASTLSVRCRVAQARLSEITRQPRPIATALFLRDQIYQN